MSVELKPCPFCGGEAVLTEGKYYSEKKDELMPAFHINCENYSPYDRTHIDLSTCCSLKTPHRAIEMWNTRHQDESTYDAGFDSGMKAALRQISGLIYEGYDSEDIEAWIDRQCED